MHMIDFQKFLDAQEDIVNDVYAELAQGKSAITGCGLYFRS